MHTDKNDHVISVHLSPSVVTILATSWEFFDQLLNECHIVGTPGSGFGACGEGYFRLSAFNSRENIDTAVARIRKAYAAQV